MKCADFRYGTYRIWHFVFHQASRRVARARFCLVSGSGNGQIAKIAKIATFLG